MFCLLLLLFLARFRTISHSWKKLEFPVHATAMKLWSIKICTKNNKVGKLQLALTREVSIGVQRNLVELQVKLIDSFYWNYRSKLYLLNGKFLPVNQGQSWPQGSFKSQKDNSQTKTIIKTRIISCCYVRGSQHFAL